MAELTRPITATAVATGQRAATRTARRWLTELFFYAVMVGLAAVFLAPLAWMLTASLKPEREVMSIPPTFIPRDFEWQNYQQVWDVIPRFLYNSVKLAFINVVGVLFVTSLAAYSFARIEFRGRGLAFAILLSTLMVPGIVTLIPLYIIYR
jgi:multiple sugar transport system permease protein/sn-glycerol 3-phosphate transport system permease protein